MKIENSTGVEFTAIIYSTSPTCNLISFPRFLSYYMVPTFLNVKDKSVVIGNDININYHDGHDSVIYIPYKVACRLDSEIDKNDTCIEHVYALGLPLTLINACANNKDLKYVEWNDYKLAESYEKGENQFTKCKNGLIIIPKKLNNMMSNIKYIGYFNCDGTGRIYPISKYDIRLSTTDDNTLYISPDLAEFLKIPKNHNEPLICFGTIKEVGNMNIIEEKNITESISDIHFQLPASILYKSIGEESQTILSIPFPYFMAIKPLFCNIVDGLKKEAEDSIIKNVKFNTSIAGHIADESGSINKIELDRTYFEDIIYRSISSFIAASGEIHFTLNNYDQHIKIDPDEFNTRYANLFNFCGEYIDKWIKDNGIEATIKLGDVGLKVDKLQICNTPTATIEIYNTEGEVTNSIISNLDIIEVELIQTGGENKNEQRR